MAKKRESYSNKKERAIEREKESDRERERERRRKGSEFESFLANCERKSETK